MPVQLICASHSPLMTAEMEESQQGAQGQFFQELNSCAAALRAFDPYPFILLNLMLSFQAAYTGPIVMMSQNRQAEKDRIAAQNDYDVNLKAEEEIKLLLEHLARQHGMMTRILERMEALERAHTGGAGGVGPTPP